MTGAAVPNQLPLKFFRFAPGAGRELPVWRSTIWPYQLPLMLLLLKAQLLARWFGESVPPEPSRNSTPAVQLSTIAFSVTMRLSVRFRMIMPVRLLVITLLAKV